MWSPKNNLITSIEFYDQTQYKFKKPNPYFFNEKLLLIIHDNSKFLIMLVSTNGSPMFKFN